jgi:hypothetical protein
MAEEFLHGADIVAMLQQLRRKTMAKGMTTDSFIYFRQTPSEFNGLLQTTFIKMMATDNTAAWIFRKTFRGKNVLPYPITVGMRIFPH